MMDVTEIKASTPLNTPSTTRNEMRYWPYTFMYLCILSMYISRQCIHVYMYLCMVVCMCVRRYECMYACIKKTIVTITRFVYNQRLITDCSSHPNRNMWASLAYQWASRYHTARLHIIKMKWVVGVIIETMSENCDNCRHIYNNWRHNREDEWELWQ